MAWMARARSAWVVVISGLFTSALLTCVMPGGVPAPATCVRRRDRGRAEGRHADGVASTTPPAPAPSRAVRRPCLRRESARRAPTGGHRGLAQHATETCRRVSQLPDLTPIGFALFRCDAGGRFRRQPPVVRRRDRRLADGRQCQVHGRSIADAKGALNNNLYNWSGPSDVGLRYAVTACNSSRDALCVV